MTTGRSLILAVVLGTIFGLAAPPIFAHESMEKGLFAESSVKVDEVTVRRIHDPHNGVVCYTATGFGRVGGHDVGHATLPAIACVRE